jgi:hypothetical protein
MTDPASGHEIAGDVSIDDQVSALGIDKNDQQSVTMSESVAVGSTSAADEDPSLSASFDVYEEDDDGTTTSRGHHRSHRKRQRADFPWSQTHDWISGDPPRQRGKRKCKVCQKWFSSATNAQGWKFHLSKQHQITAMSSQSSPNAMPRTGQQQTIFKNTTSVLPQHVLQKYENAVIDYIIGGDLSLRAAGEPRFCNLVETLTNGCYKPPSTRTILRRTVELFNIAQPLLGNSSKTVQNVLNVPNRHIA